MCGENSLSSVFQEFRVHDWIAAPHGRYYLYFAHHAGDHIRLAYADQLEGPRRIHEPGVLALEASGFATEPLQPEDVTNPQWQEWMQQHGDAILARLGPHIASPDVHVRHDRSEIQMYFHGLLPNAEQMTCLATSRDGLHFDVHNELLGPSYFRVFPYQGWLYAMAADGGLFRSRDATTAFEPGPILISPNARHTAVRLRDDYLDIFWSRYGDTPEHILVTEVRLRGEWTSWQGGPTRDVLFPVYLWEGADLPLVPSRIIAHHNQVGNFCYSLGDKVAKLLINHFTSSARPAMLSPPVSPPCQHLQ